MRRPFLLWIFLLSGCTNLFYQPSRVEYVSPDKIAGQTPKSVAFKSLDGTPLHGWFFETSVRPKKGTILHFHGNAENLTSHFTSVLWLVPEGYDLFTFDYRGYGKSEGAPFPAGVNADALSALEWTRQAVQDQPQSVIVYGQSLGGAIALRALEDLKDRKFIRTAVIESSFLSYKSMGVYALSNFWLTWPVQWLGYVLASDQYSPKKNIRILSPIPLLVMHGTGDHVVPIAQGKQIFDKALEPKCFWPIETDVHIHLMQIDGGKNRPSLIRFLKDFQCPEKGPNT
jgi:fermentation-respiration switch protein FrsA (DUF1100 family)